MKKYSKLIIAAIIALIFIGTFVFLWQKSQPKEVVYNEFCDCQGKGGARDGTTFKCRDACTSGRDQPEAGSDRLPA